MQNELKDKFENFGSHPSPGLWSSIERKLDQQKSKKRFLYWIIPLGMAASIIVLLNSVLQHTTSQKTHSAKYEKSVQLKEKFVTENDKQENLAKNKGKQSNTTKNNKVVNQTNDQKIAVNQQKKKQQKSRKKSFEKNITETLELNEITHHLNNNVGESNDNYIKNEQNEKDNILMETAKTHGFDLDSIPPRKIEHKILFDDLAKEEKTSKWSIKFNMGTWDAINNRNQQYGYLENSSIYYFSSSKPVNDVNLDAVYLSNFPSYSSESTQQLITSVLKPFTFSTQLVRKMSKNTSLFAGLNYDVLISKNKLETGYYSNISQINYRYHSLGINLGVEYKILEKNKFSLLGGFSINNDFMVHESAVFILKNEVAGKDYGMAASSGFSNFKNTKGFQNSVQVDLSLNYKLWKKSSVELKLSGREYLYQYIRSNDFILRRNFWYGISVGYKWDF